ncbi:DUF1810 domain-containing protein [Runella sp.]|uniref:DUF1810 domain-containing protein n=1 Tax=Runella sp. TaxID=1960881 RepID=UPI003D0A4295
MNAEDNLHRFLEAQDNDYPRALAEIKKGRKQGHWIWYIFPQISGLGFSATTQFYAIKDLQEAEAYLQHPVLGSRLIEISEALLSVEGKTANQILGNPDDLKVRSSMTLFSLLPKTNPIFQAVLDKFFNSIQDPRTLSSIENSANGSAGK